MDFDIYTDGGCSGNPGPGGWAYVILKQDLSEPEAVDEGSGCEKNTTNNKMELTAVIKALTVILSGKYSSEKGKIGIYTDSTYVKNGITLWIKNWEKNGWRTSSKQDVKNKELWIELKNLSDKINPNWNWVKGHAGNIWNEKCDTLVQKEIRALKEDIPL